MPVPVCCLQHADTAGSSQWGRGGAVETGDTLTDLSDSVSCASHVGLFQKLRKVGEGKKKIVQCVLREQLCSISRGNEKKYRL